MIIIAIGANLPGPGSTAPIDTCRRAAAALDGLAGLRLCDLSRWYETTPMPPSGQPPYVNGVALLMTEFGATEPDPAVLLCLLQRIETLEGRVRGEPNAARTLDLDIIAMGEGGQLVRTAPDPVLPHPRAHERRFVLEPLRDVAPGWVHPIRRRDVDELLRALPPQGVRAL